MDGLRIAQAAALGDLHGVDVADEVGDRGVGCRQLLGVALVTPTPGHRQLVAQLCRAADARRRDRVVRVLPELRSVDDRRPFVEQPDHRAQQPGLALPALAEQNNVVTRDQGPLELRDDRGLEAVQTRPRIASLPEGGEQIAPDFGPQALVFVSGCPELSDRGNRGTRHDNNATPARAPGALSRCSSWRRWSEAPCPRARSRRRSPRACDSSRGSALACPCAGS